MDETSWKYLADLLNHGYPLLDALTFINANTSYIEKRLEEGSGLIEVLLENQKGRFYVHMRFFLHIMSLSDAILSSTSLLEFEKGIKNKLLKKSMYPICILIFAYALLWFFSTAIIPQMMESFSMDASFHSLSYVVGILKYFCIGFAVCTFSTLVLLIYFMNHKKVRSMLLYKYHHKLSIVKDYESYLFSGYLKEMQMRGISTKHAMLYLSKIQEDSLFKIMIEDMHQKLLSGVNFLDVITNTTLLNKTFVMSFRIGSSTSKICGMLTTFMNQQEHLWDKTIKKISVYIQCISYSFVGIVVLIVYQIMLVPLSMLEQM